MIFFPIFRRKFCPAKYWAVVLLNRTIDGKENEISERTKLLQLKNVTETTERMKRKDKNSNIA